MYEPYLFLCVFIGFSLSNLIITTNGTSEEYTGVPYYFERNAQVFFESFNASLVRPYDGVNITGKAVFAIYPDDRKKYKEWESQGAIGIVEYFKSRDDLRIGMGTLIKLSDLSDLGIVVMAQRHFSSIPNNSTVTFLYNENRWYTVFSSPWLIVAQVFLIVTSLAALTVALVRLTQFIVRDGYRVSLPKVALFIEICGNFMRLVWVVPDPFGHLFFVYRWYNEIFQIYNTMFSNISNLLIVLYWHESMISLSLEVTPYLKKLAIPFYIFSGIIVAFETIMAILRVALFPITNLSFVVTAGFHTIANTGIMTYFTIIAYKLWRRLRSMNASARDRNMMIRLFTRVSLTLFIMVNIGLNGVLWIFWPPYQSNPVINVCLLVEVHTLFSALSITQAVSFIPPKNKTTSTSSGQLSHVRPRSQSINLRSKVEEVIDASSTV